jgi:hypothetical protein
MTEEVKKNHAADEAKNDGYQKTDRSDVWIMPEVGTNCFSRIKPTKW